MTTKIFGSSRIYLKKSKRRSLRKYQRYSKKTEPAAKKQPSAEAKV